MGIDDEIAKMIPSERMESDEKQLIEPKEVTIKVEENPPPYQQHEAIQRGLRVYPAKRAYAWLCSRGQRPYGQLENNNNSAGRSLSGLTIFLLAIPVIMLMTLGVYLVATLFFQCPNCGHHNVGIVRHGHFIPEVPHVQEAPKPVQEAPKPKIHEKIMDSPKLPPLAQRFFGSFISPNRPDRHQSLQEPKPPVMKHHQWVFVFHPKPADQAKSNEKLDEV